MNRDGECVYHYKCKHWKTKQQMPKFHSKKQVWQIDYWTFSHALVQQKVKLSKTSIFNIYTHTHFNILIQWSNSINEKWIYRFISLPLLRYTFILKFLWHACVIVSVHAKLLSKQCLFSIKKSFFFSFKCLEPLIKSRFLWNVKQ